MQNFDLLLADLRREIKSRKAIAFVGTGISLGATDGSEVASWKGLLRHGAKRCLQIVPNLPARWFERVSEEIDSDDLVDLLSAAEKVSAKLTGGEFTRWLKETIGALKVSHPAVIQALSTLQIPLVTTNYDDLVEQVTHQRPTTWKRPDQIEAILRGDEDGIIHLHGFWREPESVILGIRSYAQILSDEASQAILHALRAMRTLVFIGYGKGLADPNFAALLSWARRVFANSEYRHFRLCLQSDVSAIQAEHPPEDRIFALPYGETRESLAEFLSRLASDDTPSPSYVVQPVAQQPGVSSDPLLPGIRAIQIRITQLFRLADLLMFPQNVKTRRLIDVISSPAKLRRALNGSWTMQLGQLGAMKPVARIADRFDDQFWRISIPDFRIPTSQWLYLIPFELTLSPERIGVQCAARSLPRDSGQLLSSEICQTQVKGLLRIYPPGVGLVRLEITLTFRNSVDVMAVSELAHNFETTLFVDPSGGSRACEHLLREIVDEAANAIFTREAANIERRWQPPKTLFVLLEDTGFNPAEHLAPLKSLLKGGQPPHPAFELPDPNVKKALDSPHWRNDQILYVGDTRFSLAFVARAFAGGNTLKAQRMRDWIAETWELSAASAYATKGFFDEIYSKVESRTLNCQSLPFVENASRHLLAALQAVALSKRQLQMTGAGILSGVARDFWVLENPVDGGQLRDVQLYFSDSAERNEAECGSFAPTIDLLKEVAALAHGFRPKSLYDKSLAGQTQAS